MIKFISLSFNFFDRSELIMEYEDLMKLEELVRILKIDIEAYKNDSQLLELTPEQKFINDRAIEILERKLEAIINAKNKKQLKKHLRLKKILGDDNE